MKNKKGFTLIELLAVIVILAIIALIATPLVLNTIEKSRKNSAKDSMYGYVEAIESQNALAQLDSEKYQEVTSGDVSSINSTIKVKGTKPTSGTVTIEKGTVTSASICVNGYTVTYDGKEVTNTTKGCSESNNNQQAQVPTIATCPGCNKYVYTTSTLTIGTSTAPETATDDYTTLTDHPYFLGLITNESTGVIERAFACGIENGTAFCLEGGTTKYAEPNIGILNTVFPGCNADSSNYDAYCIGSSVNATAYSNGYMGVANDVGGCSSYNDTAYCEVF